MQLRSLDIVGASVNVVILQTPSTKLTMFLEDKLKRHYHCRMESIIDIMVAKDFDRVREVMGITPPFSDRWFVKVDLAKHYTKDLIPVIKTSPTCVFFCVCSRYKEYKRLKYELEGVAGVYDFYMGYLRRADFVYLYDAIVPESKKLPPQLFNFVVSGYAGDVDAVMGLFAHLASGGEVKTRGDITELCGLGGNTTESYIFALLKPLSGSAKGLLQTVRNRLKAGVDLAGSFGYPNLYNFMYNALFCLIELKQLMISGVVYKTVRDLPKGYDEKMLSRYQRHLWRLRDIPMTRLLTLRGYMGSKRWRSDLDLFQFLYGYYSYEAGLLVKGV